jgi:hypothetical protein
MSRFLLAKIVVILSLVLGLGPVCSVSALQFEEHDGDFFSLDKPKGWDVITAGSCAQFAFVIRDPRQPLRQVFYFGEVGPVYMSQIQKEIDLNYVQMGGHSVQWIEMPIVDPLTPENFLANWSLIASSSTAQMFMPQCPRLENLEVISITEHAGMLPTGSTGMVRALFTRDDRLGEGLFVLTTVPLLPYTASPGGGLGYGFMVTGITAPESEFNELQEDLVHILETFSISQSYVEDCLSQQAQQYAGLLKVGKTLSESSDFIMEGWEDRSRTYDIIAEKTGDKIMGKERLYDPETGSVYEFDTGFYDGYMLKQNEYEMNNLKPLPDSDYSLWMTEPLDGDKHLR